jgi:hypothetical protein
MKSSFHQRALSLLEKAMIDPRATEAQRQQARRLVQLRIAMGSKTGDPKARAKEPNTDDISLEETARLLRKADHLETRDYFCGYPGRADYKPPRTLWQALRRVLRKQVQKPTS